jgi:predicted methyltransferase
MTSKRRGALRASASLILFVVLTAATFAQNNASDAAKLVDVLQLKTGSVVAEIGAGAGELTVALAKHVGPSGRVFTSELGADRLSSLQSAIKKSGATNVEVIQGEAEHANLSDGCCDAVFMRNVYHHFNNPTTMNASIFRALKPGGRVAVIDFSPRNNAQVAAPGKRGEDAAHGVSTEVVVSELKAAGFQIVTTEDRPDAGAQRWFLVVAAKPQ